MKIEDAKINDEVIGDTPWKGVIASVIDIVIYRGHDTKFLLLKILYHPRENVAGIANIHSNPVHWSLYSP